ncbi:MAG: bile acid:sodium symporter family protein [Bacteroidetes bacterium]|jgi:BASS family bile acid:Na+ symporter|nr:bile acid:sodium symporter family protein [Bacteroidota bacterium]
MNGSFFSTYSLPIVIGLIMFTLGLSLRFRDFRRIVEQPKPLLIGLLSQMILLPGIAFMIAHLADLSPAIKAGIVVIAACPGGATSNLITYHLKGDVPLSISLTSLNSIIILVTIPLIVFLALKTFMHESGFIELPIKDTIFKIFYMILIPTAIGMTVRRFYPRFANEVEKYMKYITTILLAFVFAMVVFEKDNGGSDNPFDIYLKVAPYVFALNVLGMITGYVIARLLRFNKKKQITLPVEVGIQNSALAITITSSPVFLGNYDMAIPALVYGLFTFFNAVLFGLIIKKWLKA